MSKIKISSVFSDEWKSIQPNASVKKLIEALLKEKIIDTKINDDGENVYKLTPLGIKRKNDLQKNLVDSASRAESERFLP